MQRLRHRTRAAIAALVVAGSAMGAIIANGSAAASAPAPGGGPVVAGADAAIARLVDEHTLSAAQGAAIEHEINSGSVDPKQLVADGVVSDAQMRVAADAIDRVKAAGG